MPRTVIFCRVTQSSLFGALLLSSLTSTVTLVGFKRLITSRGATRSPGKTVSTSATQECRRFTVPKVSTSCLQATIARNRISYCSQRCERTRTNFGSWSQRPQARVKAFKWSLPLMKSREVQVSQPALSSNTFTIRCWSMVTNGTYASMWLSLQLTH